MEIVAGAQRRALLEQVVLLVIHYVQQFVLVLVLQHVIIYVWMTVELHVLGHALKHVRENALVALENVQTVVITDVVRLVT